MEELRLKRHPVSSFSFFTLLYSTNLQFITSPKSSSWEKPKRQESLEILESSWEDLVFGVKEDFSSLRIGYTAGRRGRDKAKD